MDSYISSLKTGLGKMNLPNDEKILNKFKIYTDYLLEYNKKINLTAIIDREQIVKKHYLDSLTLLKAVDIPINSKVIDIGTGAGFPLIPAKIVRQDLDCTLLDSLAKRVVFLDNLCEKLDLKDISSHHARAEDYGKKEEFRGKYDFVCIRAVAKLNILLEYAIPFLKAGGYMIALKGTKAQEELNQSKNALEKLDSSLVKIEKQNIPLSDLNHEIIVIRKDGDTSDKYPRSSGQIKKNPL